MLYFLCTAAVLLVFYLFVHPWYSRRDVRRIMVADIYASTLIVVGVILIRVITGESHGTVLGREIHWTLITVTSIALIEIPLFALYLRVMGISFRDYTRQLLDDSTDDHSSG